MKFNLQPRNDCADFAPPVQFVFDLETGSIDGPDARVISLLVEEARRIGEVELIPCYSHPVNGRLSMQDLGAILRPFWDLRGYDFPAIDVPVDPDMPEDAVQ